MKERGRKRDADRGEQAEKGRSTERQTDISKKKQSKEFSMQNEAFKEGFCLT